MRAKGLDWMPKKENDKKMLKCQVVMIYKKYYVLQKLFLIFSQILIDNIWPISFIVLINGEICYIYTYKSSN